MATRPRVVAFDVIGTTFSLEPLRDGLVKVGFSGDTVELWFSNTLRDAFALAATEAFCPFRALFDSNLDSLARQRALGMDMEQKQGLLDLFGALPAHPDATHALQLLRGSGVRAVALTNGAAKTATRLIERSGFEHSVERVISVEDISVFKPRRDIYLHAAQAAGVLPGELALVSTHAWDVHGAKCAGLTAGFVARGQVFPKTMKAPDVIAESLVDVVRLLLS